MKQTKAEVEEVTNVSYTLKVDYPITDTEIYKKFQEDMLIIAPTPVTGRQLFRIKEISEQDDTVNPDLPAHHRRHIQALCASHQGFKFNLSNCLECYDFSSQDTTWEVLFHSNIMDNRTFNTTEDETLYKILMDGKHSIVGAWEGEMIRDNFPD